VLAIEVGHGHIKAQYCTSRGDTTRLIFHSYALPTAAAVVANNSITSGRRLMNVKIRPA
jgi:hypothetical protein